MKKILVLDFGGQFAQLIATKIRSLHAYSEICAPEDALEKIDDEVAGVIFSGGPASVYEAGSPTVDPAIFDLGKPILGICYGHQLITQLLGGKVSSARDHSEFGKAEFEVLNPVGIFAGLPAKSVMWMSHGDETEEIAEGFEIVGRTTVCNNAATANLAKNIFTVQFHPEVVHSEYGLDLLSNFVELCGLRDSWKLENFIEDAIVEIHEQVGDKNVFLMVSGGVDSSVVFALLNRALGKERVFGLFVDTGLLRLNEAQKVQKMLGEAGFDNLHTSFSEEKFLTSLKEVFDPEQKRAKIGNDFLNVQAEVSEELKLNPEDWFLAQGTIFPDTIESGGSKHSDKIKTHHNRVPRIEELIKKGRLVEPLKMLFKDEVRQVGRLLGLPEEMVARQPFPGPGLGVRILCTEEADIDLQAQEAEQKIKEQYGMNFQVLPLRSVGVQGDFRTFAHPIAIFNKEFDREQLNEIATEIPNAHRSINRVIFCLSSDKALGDIQVPRKYITKERIQILQKADDIVHCIMNAEGLTAQIWQFPVILAPLSFAGGESIILRPVESIDAMTAVSAHIPEKILRKMSAEIIKNVAGVDAVFYDLTSKPPGTIEWE